MSSHMRAASLVLGLVFLQPFDVGAASIRKMPLSELIDESAVICRARVVALDPRAFDSSESRPFSRVTLEVVESLSGAMKAGDRLEFLVWGGLRPNGNLGWPHIPHFTAGHTYLVFLRGGDYTATPVTNWQHSIFRETTFGGGTIYVDQDGAGVVEINTRGFTVGDKVAESEFLTYTRQFGWEFQENISKPKPGLSRGSVSVSDRKSSAPSARVAPAGLPATEVVRVLRQEIRARGAEAGGRLADLALRPRPLPLSSMYQR